MAAKTDILVYAHWAGMKDPRPIGILSAQQAKGKKAFSFAYDNDWIHSREQQLLDPDIQWWTGPQYPYDKENFGVFMDSMPDTWGRTLMKRRAALEALENKTPVRTLYDIDFLLGVNDGSRTGALRFKLEPGGPFVNNNAAFPTPHWSGIRELQHAATVIESDHDDKEISKWMAILIAPGSSLGGARPKANILDDRDHPWIAKFPAHADTINKAAWEFLAYTLALRAGINMSGSRIEKIAGRQHTFFTKRFDRNNKKERVHFASAMTMTGNSEEKIKDSPPSYLDLAEFIQDNSAESEADLGQLWRRIVFNIAISNTDDHLRNHGFILTPKGWSLSPAYDINPSIDKDGLALNIDTDNNALSLDLARSVGEYFGLDGKQMETIIKKIMMVRKNWKEVAEEMGIARGEQKLMAAAFEREIG
jgi:serine/threonine-protein kinase HipA